MSNLVIQNVTNVDFLPGTGIVDACNEACDFAKTHSTVVEFWLNDIRLIADKNSITNNLIKEYAEKSTTTTPT